MSEFGDKEVLEAVEKVLGLNETGDRDVKIVKIIQDKKHFTIRIPKKYAEIMKLEDKKDKFEFHLIPDKEIQEKFHLVGVLKK